MKALGVIVEYNPFHNGHWHHLHESKALTGRKQVVAVMSGNFVQRGEPALCDKWTRVRTALAHGIDLVLELPLCYATAAADYFARASVKLLHASGIVDSLCFGSESGDIGMIKLTARLLANELADKAAEGCSLAGDPSAGLSRAYRETLKACLSEGLSFAVARARALEGELSRLVKAQPGQWINERLAAYSTGEWLSLPNNILGIEYVKALYRLNSPIQPYTVKRVVSSEENDASGTRFLSAGAIRNFIINGRIDKIKNAMPETALARLSEALERDGVRCLDAYGDLFQYRLRTLSADALRSVQGMSEGLENRFRLLCGQYRSLTDLLTHVKTKRYAFTRLQRVALHTVLGITSEMLNTYEQTGGPAYIRVLGFRKESAFLLRELQQNAKLPVVVNLKHAPRHLSGNALQMLEKEIESTGLYALAGKKSIHAINHEYTMPLVTV